MVYKHKLHGNIGNVANDEKQNGYHRIVCQIIKEYLQKLIVDKTVPFAYYSSGFAEIFFLTENVFVFMWSEA